MATSSPKLKVKQITTYYLLRYTVIYLRLSIKLSRLSIIINMKSSNKIYNIPE